MSIDYKVFTLLRMDVPWGFPFGLGSRDGVGRIGPLPWRHVASDLLDDHRADGQIGVRSDVVHSSHSGTIELVGGRFEHTVGSFDRSPLGIEVFP